MSHPTWIVEPLSGGHDRREGFACGNSALDHDLKEQANQDLRRGCAVPFVLIPSAGESAVLGYYTLSSFGIDAGVVPPEITKKLPRYPLIPATLLGRLAVDERHHGEGIGEFLFMDALHRSRAQSGQIAAVAVVVEAIDERAERFYQHFGFIPFPTITGRLFIMMKTVKQLFA